MADAVTESDVLSLDEALRTGRQGGVQLVGQLDYNQGRPTFTGRMTLEQFAELTVVHNRRWQAEAGETIDIVTQREIIDAHANGLAAFMLQGLIDATRKRAEREGSEMSEAIWTELDRMQDHVGRSGHYGIPQVTLVLREVPQFKHIRDGEEIVASRLRMPAGTLLIVADGQHRREAARRVKEFLIDVIANRRIPPHARFYVEDGALMTSSELDAWQAIQETFRTHTRISYEVHIALTTDEARQMFTNYNCHVKPVKADINLEFDKSNPVNMFAKVWLTEVLAGAPRAGDPLSLRQMAQINGFLFLGKTSIRSAPYNVETMEPAAREFWNTVVDTDEWRRPGSLIGEVAVLKGLAKAWFYVFLARRNRRPDAADQVRRYIRTTRFDVAWIDTVPGLRSYVLAAAGDTVRFQPAHNEIVARIVEHALGSP